MGLTYFSNFILYGEGILCFLTSYGSNFGVIDEISEL